MTILCATRGTALAAVLLFWAPAAGAQVIINEFAYDDSGEDDEEFVELYNAGDETVDLTGWILETGADTGPGPPYDLPPGTEIEAKGTLVLGSPLVPNAAVVLGATDLFGNGPGYLILRTAEDDAADAVAYEANKGTAAFPPEAIEGRGIWGNHVLVAATHMSWQRWRDGRDTDDNGADFGHMPWTPGASNDRANPLAFASDFEDGDPESEVAALPGTFVPARIIDPLLASTSNPGAIPESPDGGYALIAWDPAGGGNVVVLEAAPAADLVFEAWVYLDARRRPPEELESWSIGLRGTSGTFYNLPIIYDQNGNTGVAWTYQVTSSGATLYLVDEGVGGAAAEKVRLGEIAVVPGDNDGWQRLRLEVRGDAVDGYFGGTYGSTDDGVHIAGTTRAAGIGGFYIGYREALTDDGGARPPTLDSLRVGPPGPAGPLFRRGDCNGNRTFEIGDPIGLLNYLFADGPSPGCLDACDIDDNGRHDVGDAIRLLNFLFASGPPPADPFPDCGVDPTPEGPGCEGETGC